MLHKHKCKSCGHIWEHRQDDEASDQEYHNLHDCPECGVNQRRVYFETPADEKAWEAYQRKRDPVAAFLSDLLDHIESLRE